MNTSTSRSFGRLFGRGRGWRLAWAQLLLAVVVMTPLASRADTVASLLGDFTINQYAGLKLADDEVKLHFAVVFGQLPALRELHQADGNGDGVTTQQERDAYVSKLAPELAQALKVTIDGAAVPLRAAQWTSSLPKEQTGFSMRIDIDYAGSLPPAASDAPRSFRFANTNFPGRVGWHEISVAAPQELKVFDTDAFSTSLTDGLTEALQSLPANGPLDERAVHLRFTRGSVPAGAQMLAARDGAAFSAPANASASAQPPADAGWLPTQTRRLINLISTPDVPVQIAALALAAAMLLGALHALSPGHGKSIVGAYLVGSRGTPRHAVFLGVTVTITHTLVVFAIGLATLFASRYILPERIFPVLSLLSGLLVFGMGLVLLAQRWRSALSAWTWGSQATTARRPADGRGLAFAAAYAGDHSHAHHQHDHGHSHSHGHSHGHSHSHDGHSHSHASAHSHAVPAAHSHTHVQPHQHSHDHDHGSHSHGHGDALSHSHGGTVHSHLPPGANGEAISWRGLLALGVSGGLLPCPSAMVLLLAAVALNKTLFGLLLVVAFSVGLAATLTAVGLVFLYARNRLQGRLASSRWPHLLPVLSAASITLLGAALCVGTLVGNGPL